METVRPERSSVGGFLRAVSRIVRYRRGGKERGAGVVTDEVSVGKPKFAEGFNGASLSSSHPGFPDEDEKKKKQPPLQEQRQQNREVMETLLAELFAGIAAIKASYAQLQVAQSPYDPDTIQSADQVVVAELKQLSQLKHSYFKQIDAGTVAGCGHSGRDSQLLAELQEQKNLVKTFQITVKKLEAELLHKDAEVLLKKQALDAEQASSALRRPLQVLSGLRPSSLNPSHFLAAFRRLADRSDHSPGRLCGGWSSPGGTSMPPPPPPFRFRGRSSGGSGSTERSRLSPTSAPPSSLASTTATSPRRLGDRREFFDELPSRTGVRQICRAKYLIMVHPAMDESFSGGGNARAVVSSGEGFPETEFYQGFAEMARRVWLLHRLFFSFGPKEEASIFQARRGCRFSEVFMESVVEPEEDAGGAAVGFTVAPGFRLRKTIYHCKVYLAAPAERRRSGV
ncbi:unnamed protein product [Spirodela intermedia]|uniref:Uncharacterized protein n=1 Tax=Spirodela intermedia TaxID=51605 RepID=A0A7I8J893_SPIIN|nr:unnamed protein product [Spirodela intermedia]CAA6665652.1 unnamed protein product [Spirodela intermedia]